MFLKVCCCGVPTVKGLFVCVVMYRVFRKYKPKVFEKKMHKSVAEWRFAFFFVELLCVCVLCGLPVQVYDVVITMFSYGGYCCLV